MSQSGSGQLWGDTAPPELIQLARQYESDLRASPVRRLEPRNYLPSAPEARPAALLALLRVDMALRWQACERVPVEWYRDRYPELDGEGLVALIYEEYCLREEAGETPDAAEYAARFPDAASSFQAVLEIHTLVRQEPDPAAGPRAIAPWEAPLPEVGQTIAGYRLVEELGRGSFARVFRALERQLADRPVAMKVTRTGSREPQTLARLQHTHIVPVYSYRTDPATGLHLLCMPYLGRLTLARVLGDPAIFAARSGTDLALILDRLQAAEPTAARPLPSGPAPAPSPAPMPLAPPAGSRALAGRPYAGAIAWWGARLAEALQHAHDRGVLHGDIKPSNILVTDDALPMLLDFNLAQGPWPDSPEEAPAALGGTLAYMAPEKLEALARGDAEPGDARSDLYALGVVLFECLVRGSRMFAVPHEAKNLTEAMRQAAEVRRDRIPRVRTTHPDVPAAFEAVVARCLAPDPDDRYAAASELAIDLQAVADDAPLCFAREPLASRSVRWLRRNRRRLALAAPLVLAIVIAALTLVDTQMAQLRRIAEVEQELHKGAHAVDDDRLDLAESHFVTAADLAGSSSGARLLALHARAEAQADRARRSKDVREKVDHLFAVGNHLRFALLGFGGDPGTSSRDLDAALKAFSVLDDPDWLRRPPIRLLDHRRWDGLRNEVNELLFLWVVALDHERPGNPDMARQAVRICDAALGFATPTTPWLALRERYAARLRGQGASRPLTLASAEENSARGCFQRGLLSELDEDDAATVAWLERATQLDPGDYWTQFYLGFYHERCGHDQQALVHYEAAVALRKDSPWAWYNRALLERARGDWDQSLVDLDRALALAGAQGFDFLEARLNRGVVLAGLGDAAAARAAYDSVIATTTAEPFLIRAARLNRAQLDFESGAVNRAGAEYDTLLAEDPRDVQARLSRALLDLRTGRAARAEADLTILLRDDPKDAAEFFARRALARLSLRRPLDAEADAVSAYRRKPGPSFERLWIRTLLALDRPEDLLWLKSPDDLAVLPGDDQALRDDLRRAVEQLGAQAGPAQPAPALIHRTRAVLLCALDDRSALAEADRVVAMAPDSDDAYLIRARIRRHFGDRKGALSDIEAGLVREPGEPRLLELQGILETETGHPGAALVVLNRAVVRGASTRVHGPKAMALMTLGRHAEAVEQWSLALADDPEDPRLYLGRAKALIRLGHWARALADLEQADAWAGNHPALLARITLTSAACLPARPDCLAQWLARARRTVLAWGLRNR